MFTNLIRRLGWCRPKKRTFTLEAGWLEAVQELADYHDRTPEETVFDLLATGLEQRRLLVDVEQRWQGLTPREQEVAGLVCQGYTNHQIAAALSIAHETVKVHMHNILVKLNVTSRGEISKLLAG